MRNKTNATDRCGATPVPFFQTLDPCGGLSSANSGNPAPNRLIQIVLLLIRFFDSMLCSNEAFVKH